MNNPLFYELIADLLPTPTRLAIEVASLRDLPRERRNKPLRGKAKEEAIRRAGQYLGRTVNRCTAESRREQDRQRFRGIHIVHCWTGTEGRVS